MLLKFYTLFILLVIFIDNYNIEPFIGLMTSLEAKVNFHIQKSIKEIDISVEEDLSQLYIPPHQLRNILADPVGSICGNIKYYNNVPPYFHFFPAHKGKLYKVGDKFSFKNKCFLKNTIEN